MLGLLLFFLLAAFVCGRLGIWQLDKSLQRERLAEKQSQQEAEQPEVQALTDVLAPQSTFRGELVGAKVQVSGQFLAAKQLQVVERKVNDRVGYLTVNALQLSDSGVIIPVVLGWQATPEPVNLPTDTTLSIEGYLQASEATTEKTFAYEAPLTDAISTAALVNQWGGPTFGAYLVYVATDATVDASLSSLTLLPRPVIDSGQDHGLRNLLYALQWWVFGAFAILLWVRTVSDAARDEEKPNPFDQLNKIERKTT